MGTTKGGICPVLSYNPDRCALRKGPAVSAVSGGGNNATEIDTSEPGIDAHCEGHRGVFCSSVNEMGMQWRAMLACQQEVNTGHQLGNGWRAIWK
eukprot:1139261-Pelagomonas_calceolata.AAC.5